MYIKAKRKNPRNLIKYKESHKKLMQLDVDWQKAPSKFLGYTFILPDALYIYLVNHLIKNES